jgi:hypothetical protein
MYSIAVDGKVLDYHYKKGGQDFIYNFYIGDIFIGQIFKLGKGDWAPVTFHTKCPYKNVRGFRNRFCASEFMLIVCGFIKDR